MSRIANTFSKSTTLVRAQSSIVILIVCFASLHASALRAPQMPRGEKHEVRHEIDQLEDQWRDAVLKANASTMDRLLADDYMAITASGTLETREQALASLRSGKVHITNLALSERKVRFYGTTALVTSRAEVQGAGDSDHSGNFRYTHVYVREPNGAWKIVSFEASRVRESGEHK